MLSQEKLLKVIRKDLAGCRKAGRTLTDARGVERKKIEVTALLKHVQMVKEAGADPTKLEAVVKSLEKHSLLSGHQHWREKATI